jgi:hypothetical protein
MASMTLAGEGPGYEPNLGFVLAATISGPADPCARLLSGSGGTQVDSATAPGELAEHFMLPGDPRSS